jgi:dUTP pyrophosphatase
LNAILALDTISATVILPRKEKDMQVKIKLNSPDAKLPEYKTAGASGMDVCAVEDCTVWHEGGIKAVSTGLHFKIPEGYEIQVRPRSGLSLKGITVMNSPGTVDSDYTGELKVIIANFGIEPFHVKKGDRIAQIILCPIIRAELQVVAELEQTERGSGGFGSTGLSS